LQLLPSLKLERSEWCTHTDLCLSHLDELIAGNRNFDFYWYPRNDLIKIRLLNEPGNGMQKLSYAEQVLHGSGDAIEILPRERDLKFDEMEYAFPFEAGPECFSEIRKIIKSKFRKTVAWRVLYRTIAADENYLSPHTGRNSVTISLHQNAGLPFMDYFCTIEPVFRHFGGRPHWGKKHTLKATKLKQSYPEWNKFMQIRKQMDPHGLFMNEYLKQIFDEDEKPG
jgi:FAD/FMN-containing dehydrogenase